MSLYKKEYSGTGFLKEEGRKRGGGKDSLRKRVGRGEGERIPEGKWREGNWIGSRDITFKGTLALDLELLLLPFFREII